MRSILVPVEESPSLEAQLQGAALVAEIFNAHIDGTTPSWPISFESAMDSMPTTAGWFSAEETRTAAAEQKFREFVERRGIAWEDTIQPTDHPSANWLGSPDWLGSPGPGDLTTAELARLYDLTVVGRRVAKSVTPRAELLEAVLFESGRPILVTPPTPPQRLGEVILIAWNGSMESARVITFAKPLLDRAKRVVVLSVEGGNVSGPNAGDVERALRRDGIFAEATGFRPVGQTTGEAVLREAENQGADLLVKGAYTRSRLRQLVFGGTTRHILQAANLPVLMSH
jgi:nucleotide-binding universal stress UspA family protein